MSPVEFSAWRNQYRGLNTDCCIYPLRGPSAPIDTSAHFYYSAERFSRAYTSDDIQENKNLALRATNASRATALWQNVADEIFYEVGHHPRLDAFRTRRGGPEYRGRVLIPWSQPRHIYLLGVRERCPQINLLINRNARGVARTAKYLRRHRASSVCLTIDYHHILKPTKSRTVVNPIKTGTREPGIR